MTDCPSANEQYLDIMLRSPGSHGCADMLRAVVAPQCSWLVAPLDYLCYRTDCQAIGGASHYAANIVPIANLKVTAGEPSTYKKLQIRGVPMPGGFVQRAARRSGLRLKP